MKQEVPEKVPRIESPSEPTAQPLTPPRTDVESTPSILEPELVVVPMEPKEEPIDIDEPSEAGEYSEHSLPEMDMSSMLDTSLGETSSQSSVCWKADAAKYSQRPVETNAPGIISLFFLFYRYFFETCC